jgi:hypothetical protein
MTGSRRYDGRPGRECTKIVAVAGGYALRSSRTGYPGDTLWD